MIINSNHLIWWGKKFPIYSGLFSTVLQFLQLQQFDFPIPIKLQKLPLAEKPARTNIEVLLKSCSAQALHCCYTQ